MATDPTKRTQAVKILDYIKHFGSITQFDALIELGCMRLASRVNDLRNDGHLILTEMVEVKTRSGTAKVASYKFPVPA